MGLHLLRKRRPLILGVGNPLPCKVHGAFKPPIEGMALGERKVSPQDLDTTGSEKASLPKASLSLAIVRLNRIVYLVQYTRQPVDFVVAHVAETMIHDNMYERLQVVLQFISLAGAIQESCGYEAPGTLKAVSLMKVQMGGYSNAHCPH